MSKMKKVVVIEFDGITSESMTLKTFAEIVLPIGKITAIRILGELPDIFENLPRVKPYGDDFQSTSYYGDMAKFVAWNLWQWAGYVVRHGGFDERE